MRTHRHPFGHPALFVMLAVACACADDPVASRAPLTEPGRLTAEYECTVEIAAGTMNCRPVGLAGTAPRMDVLPGAGPLTFASSWFHSRGSTVDEDTSTATMYFTNNMGQLIGTTDGATVHPDGNRLFFTTIPSVVSVYSGTVAGSSIYLDFPDGTDTFTNPEGTMTFTSRPYYTFSGIVAPGATSTSRAIRYIYSSNVKSFRYAYRVSTPVQYEYGWVVVAPSAAPVLGLNETALLTGTVHDAFGTIQADGITWSSSNSSVAVVDVSTGEVTAVGQGTATITAMSSVNGQRNGTRAVIVDAAPAVSSTSPADGATDASPGGAIVVQFSEPVSVSASSFSLGCTSGSQPFTISGSGTSTVTLSPVSSLPTGDTCTVTVQAANVSDADANDGPDQLAENYSFWFVVEGFGGSM